MTMSEEHGITRREMMGLGLGAGAAAGLVLGAGLPLTAAAAPATNHAPAWMPLPKVLGPTLPNLAYVGIDGIAFHSLQDPGTRYTDPGTGVGAAGARLAAPLSLPIGSIVRQINIGYVASAGTDLSLQIFERVFDSAPTTDWQPVATAVGPGADSTGSTVTVNLQAPVTIQHGRSYSLQFVTVPGMSIRGVTVGYQPPTATFVPFAGATPRVLDTRGGSKLGFGDEIVVDLGNPGARGALFNLTVTETENGGFVSAFAADITYPGSSSVNYTATGQTVANGVVSALSPDGRIKLRGGGPAGSCHVIVDRLGWFV
jgi:hypothetical protein